MRQYKKAGIVACSNALQESARGEMEQLKRVMESQGIELVFSDFLYAKNGIRSGTGKERADALIQFYCDDSIDVIFDVSGGDVANEVLQYLNYEMIENARNQAGQIKEFWGYSDLTVLLNAIYTKTGNPSVLYQVRYIEHMLQLCEEQAGEWKENRCIVFDDQMFQAQYHFLRGTEMSGIVVGGNIRCFLKLAGTQYFPDMNDKILFLEARSGLEPQMRTYLSQLQHIGVFEKISGVYLGTFTQWEQALEQQQDDDTTMTMEQLIQEYVPMHIPIVKTDAIGHAKNSKALPIGKKIFLK